MLRVCDTIKQYLRYTLPFGEDVLEVNCSEDKLAISYRNPTDEKDQIVKETVEMMKKEFKMANNG